ncbi:MAG: hypothetical protein B6D34_10380 [Candidatus Brocadia sp. UTAMX1]|nr:MAG: hypothetical protein B6D34_10380 [Candidatus Brocadia sp. UTAMX1]
MIVQGFLFCLSGLPGGMNKQSLSVPSGNRRHRKNPACVNTEQRVAERRLRAQSGLAYLKKTTIGPCILPAYVHQVRRRIMVTTDIVKNG